MNRRLALLIFMSSAAILVPSPVRAQADAPTIATAAPTDPGAIVGGVLGSGIGLTAGVIAGHAAAEQFDIARSGDDPGLPVAFGGALLGSVVGTTAGTALLSSASESPPSLGRRLRDSVIGMLLGLAVGWGTARLSDSPTAGAIVYSTTQGVFAGLSNGRW